MHFQSITICGRAADKPVQTEKLVKVRIACNSTDQTLFITACAYGSVGEALLRSVAKGSKIIVHGALRLAQRDDKSIYWVDIHCFDSEKPEPHHLQTRANQLELFKS